MHLVAAGMAAVIRVEQLAELEMAYPTFTAIVGLAARRGGGLGGDAAGARVARAGRGAGRVGAERVVETR